jgi:hypothetical protein
MLGRIRARMTFPTVVSLLALFVALGAGTFAVGAIPGKDGQVTACYAKRGGALRVIDGEKKKAKCRKGEKKIAWSQQGPPGIPGAQGTQGPGGSPDAPAEVLGKLSGVDGAGSGLDADTLDGVTADGFLRSQRILYGREPASENEKLVLSLPAMGLEVRTYDPDAGDSIFHVRVRNTNPAGGTRFYVIVGGSATPIAPGASSRFGGLTGLPDALIVENLGSGRMVRLSCFATVIASGDDNFMQCMAITAGPGT